MMFGDLGRQLGSRIRQLLPGSLVRSLHDKWRWYGIVLVSLVVGAIYVFSFAPKISGTDDAAYMVAAKALATGHGFSKINLVGDPPETYYPPGFPILLTPIMLLFPESPENIVPLMLVPMLFGIVSVPLIYLYLVHEEGDKLAPFFMLAIAFLVGINWVWIRYIGHTLLSEMAYVVCSISALWAVHRYEASNRALHLRLLVAGVLALSAFYIRTVGLTLLLGSVIYLFLKRKPGKALLLGVLCLLGVAPWLFRNYQISASPLGHEYRNILVMSYADTFMMRDWYRPDLGSVQSVSEVVARIFSNTWGHATWNVPYVLFPALVGERVTNGLASMGLGWIPGMAGILMSIGIIIGYLCAVRWRLSPLDVYVPLYVGMILFTPWVNPRNLVPILPFLLLYLALGILSVIKWLVRWLRLDRLTQAEVFAILLVFLFFTASQLWCDRANLRVGANYRNQGLYYYPEEASMEEVSEWIKRHVPDDAVVLFTSSSDKLYLYTGRQGHPMLSTMPRPLGHRDPDEVLGLIEEHVEYVITMPSDTWNNIEPLNAAIAADKAHFTEIYRTTHIPSLVVYEVVHD
jgi:hypothetical protein